MYSFIHLFAIPSHNSADCIQKPNDSGELFPPVVNDGTAESDMIANDNLCQHDSNSDGSLVC